MRAAVRFRYGGPEVVDVQDVPMPTTTEDRVLVRVQAASVNRADLDGLYPRWQFYRLIAGLRRPRSPRLGLDVAGVVEAVGPDVTQFKPGDRVYGDLFLFGLGAFAEYVCVRQQAFGRIPDGLSFEDAATLPHSAVLALEALRLRDGRQLERGDRLLIDGASGNVGPFAIQIAKAWGAEVTGTCRTEKMDFVRSLGADHVLDYRTTDYTRMGDQFDWIVDVDSHHLPSSARRALKPGGTYLTLGGSMAEMLSLLAAPLIARSGRRHMGLLMGWRPFNRAPEVVATLEDLVVSGKVRPAIDRRFRLEEIAAALRYVDDGSSRGKVVITG